MRYVLLLATAPGGGVKTMLVDAETFEDDPTPASYFPPRVQTPEKIGEVEVDGDEDVLAMMTDAYVSE